MMIVQYQSHMVSGSVWVRILDPIVSTPCLSYEATKGAVPRVNPCKPTSRVIEREPSIGLNIADRTTN